MENIFLHKIKKYTIKFIYSDDIDNQQKYFKHLKKNCKIYLQSGGDPPQNTNVAQKSIKILEEIKKKIQEILENKQKTIEDLKEKLQINNRTIEEQKKEITTSKEKQKEEDDNAKLKEYKNLLDKMNELLEELESKAREQLTPEEINSVSKNT